MDLFDNNPNYHKALAIPTYEPIFQLSNQLNKLNMSNSDDSIQEDLFDNNIDYDNSFAVPQFEPIFRLNTRYSHQNKYVDWSHLQPLNCILYKNQNDYFHILHDKIEDGMFDVYNTQEHKNEFQMLSEIKYFKRTKITARKQKEFPSQFLNIYKELDKVYELELHLQRGVNPFLHQPNYVQPITVYANFSTLKNLKNTVDLLEKLYLPNKICIYMKNNDLDHTYKGKFSKVEIKKSILNEQIQIIYNKLDEKSNIGEQLWSCLKIIQQNLVEGGCFVFEIKNLANSSFAQFLYLFQKLFLVISIDNNDYLTLSTKISCYGFQRNTSMHIIDKVVQNQNQIIQKNYNIFKLRDLTQDSKFEYEIVKFYKRYQQKVSQQNKLIQHFSDGNEISYQEFIQECTRLKERINDRKKKTFNEKPYREYKADNSVQNQNAKVLNQKKEIKDFQIEVPTYKPQWTQQSNKKKEVKTEQELKEEQEKRKLEQLLQGGGMKKQSTKELLQKKYNEQLNLKGKKEYKTTAQDRRKKH